MLIGLISDTHDNIHAIKAAVSFFNSEGVDLVLHAGDYVAPFTAEFFKELKCRLIGVYGNVDGDRELLKERYINIGAEIKGFMAVLDLSGIKVALIHGSPMELVNALAKCGEYDVVVHGHTHRARCEKLGVTLVVNPGEACGYLTGKGTIALLELPELKVNHVVLHELNKN